MATSGRTTARLYVVCATKAPVAVIFRRGPSKQVQLIKWNLKTNRFDYGQWFKGRIYERRCDLSPSGDMLIYLAANQKKPYYAWTAISKPPYLTALALWPNVGTWGGGGLFLSERHIAVNVAKLELAEGFRMTSSIHCERFGSNPGRGEDASIHHAVLLKQGWQLLDFGNMGKPDYKANVTWFYARPEIYAKPQGRYQLHMLTKGIHQRNDSWYWVDYEIHNEADEVVVSLPHLDWADWGLAGNLLFAKDGKLFSLSKASFKRFADHGLEAARLLVDLNGQKFYEKVAPYRATTW